MQAKSESKVTVGTSGNADEETSTRMFSNRRLLRKTTVARMLKKADVSLSTIIVVGVVHI